MLGTKVVQLQGNHATYAGPNTSWNEVSSVLLYLRAD